MTPGRRQDLWFFFVTLVGGGWVLAVSAGALAGLWAAWKILRWPLLLLVLVVAPAVAGDATSIWGIPIQPPPPGLFSPEPWPSGDTPDGIGLFVDPATGTLAWQRGRISSGASAVGQMLFLLTGNTQNVIVGDIGPDGFRGHLAAYVPPGVWDVEGRVVLSGPSNTEFDVLVMQGHDLSPDPRRAGIVSESPQVVGGGVGTSPGPDWMLFSIPFAAYGVQFRGDPGQANEISVWVYPKIEGFAGAVMGGVMGNERGGGIPLNYVSSFVVRRVRP